MRRAGSDKAASGVGLSVASGADFVVVLIRLYDVLKQVATPYAEAAFDWHYEALGAPERAALLDAVALLASFLTGDGASEEEDAPNEP